jgi:hypothetical protein
MVFFLWLMPGRRWLKHNDFRQQHTVTTYCTSGKSPGIKGTPAAVLGRVEASDDKVSSAIKEAIKGI